MEQLRRIARGRVVRPQGIELEPVGFVQGLVFEEIVQPRLDLGRSRNVPRGAALQLIRGFRSGGPNAAQDQAQADYSLHCVTRGEFPIELYLFQSSLDTCFLGHFSPDSVLNHTYLFFPSTISRVMRNTSCCRSLSLRSASWRSALSAWPTGS